MKRTLKRRDAIATGVALFGTGVLGGIAARAQGALPKGPVRLLVGYTPGGTADFLGRLLAQKLAERTGLNFVVENKPGAGGVIATEMVTKAPPDGNTLLLANMASTIMAKLTYPKLHYDPQKDLAPVSLVCTFQHALMVTPSLPVNNTAEFIAWAKANPDKASFGIPAVGGHSHFFVLMLGKTIGVDAQVVPYKGAAPIINDLIGGQLNVGISGVSDVQPSYKAGKVKVIATSGKERALATPNLPTFTESGFPALAGEGWFAVYAPAKTQAAIVDAWSGEIQAILKEPETRDRLIQFALDPRSSTPAGLAEFDEKEFKQWQPVVAASGFKVE